MSERPCDSPTCRPCWGLIIVIPYATGALPASARVCVLIGIVTIIIAAFAAPMPYLGGHLPEWLAAAGLPLPGLRWNFYLAGALGLLAAVIGRFIREDGAKSVSHLTAHQDHRGQDAAAEHLQDA